jgi:lipopolysaccharide/colanic/teichoic acid biosynthesis glycosyltransferase
METTSQETIFISNTQQPSLRKWRSGFFKRAFDIFASALGLFFLSPLFGLLAIAIRRDSPGPVFYRGPRLGLGGRPFGILKFRTMREEKASYDGPRVTAGDDARVTPLGKWLRDTKLNELPQLWNVLIGEMSLVGPRPEDPELAGTWPCDLRAEVLSVRPGITSPASVLFRDEEKMLSGQTLMETYLGDITPSKLRLDQLYVRHRSFLLDLDVLLWTFLVVLIPSLREKQPPEEYLFWGPISRLGRRYVNWFLMDTLTTLAAFGTMGILLRLLGGPLDVGLIPALAIAVAYSVLFSAIAAAAGVQNISWANASASEALDLLPPVALSYLTALGVNIWLNLLPNAVLLGAAVLAFGGYGLTRYRSRLLTGMISRWVGRRGGGLGLREMVLIVGAGETGQIAAWRLSRGQALANFQVAGFVDDDMYRQGARISGFNVLGKSRDIPALVQEHDIGLIIFAIHRIAREERREILRICRATGARVVTWPDMPYMLSTLGRREPLTHDAASDSLPEQEGGTLEESDGMIQWLDTLEADLNQGDYSSALEQIHCLRVSLQSKYPPEEVPHER